jgi:hypothetical protein
MRITKSDIKQAIGLTPARLDKTDIRTMKSILLGFYTQKDANWSWELHVIAENNIPMIVAVRFGFIVAEGAN